MEPGASPHTFDDSSEFYDFLYEDIKKDGALVGGKGIAGTRSNFANRMREGSYRVQGKLATYTCPADLDFWLPRILGGAEVADVFDVDDALPSFGMLINRVAGTFEYQNCLVDKAIWRTEAGPGDDDPEIIEQVLDIKCRGEVVGTSWPTPAPTLSTGSNRNAYIAADGVITIGGTPYAFHDFVLLLDNHVRERWVNSLTPTQLCPQDRTVILRITFPFTASADAVLSGIYQNINRHAGVSATISLTLSGVACSTSFALTSLQWAQRAPTVPGKTDLRLTVDFGARRTGEASEIVVTNDSAA